MTTTGIETRRANGSVMIDSLSVGGVLLDVLTCPATTSGQKSYPRALSSGLSVYYARTGGHNISQKDVQGQTGTEGAIVWQYSINKPQIDTVLYVFAKQLADPELWGLRLWNDNNEMLADTVYPAPQWAATTQLAATADYSYNTPDGYKVNVHSVVVSTRPSSDRLVILNLPDTGTDDTWYQLRKESVLASEGSAKVEVAVYTKATSYTLPSLHVYALNQPIQSSESSALQVRDAVQKITFDSGAEVLSRRNELQTQYVGPNSTVTYTLQIGCTGVSIPYFRDVQVTNYTDGSGKSDETTYVGVARRVGTQITFNILKDRFRSGTASPEAAVTWGGYFLRYVPVVDVSQLTPSNIGGTAAAQISTYPSFPSSPNNSVNHPGDTASFSVSVSGYPAPTLQWYRNGVAVAGATSTTYSYTVSLSNDHDTVYCIATNFMGTEKSGTATTYVNNVQAPQITNSQAVYSATEGNTVTFSMSASGSPTPLCSISVAGRSTVSAYSSVSTTFVAAMSNNGSFQFKAESNDGTFASVVTSNGSLTVTSKTPPPSYPNFSQNLATDTYITAGQYLSLSISASPATGYQWYQNNAPISGQTSSSLYLGPLDTGYDLCQYFCRVYNNAVYTDSSTTLLHVAAAQAPATFPNYYNPGDYYVDDYGTLTWGASGTSTDSGPWASGSGDASLYSIMATSAGGTAPAGAAYDTWYNMSSGATWRALAPTKGSKYLNFNWQIKHNASGTVVSSGNVQLVAESGTPL